MPGQVQAGRTLVHRAHAVLPAVAGDEVAARVAHGGNAKFTGQFQDVLAEAVLIGVRVSGFEDPGVDAPAQVLNERAKRSTADGAHGERRIDGDFGCGGLWLGHRDILGYFLQRYRRHCLLPPSGSQGFGLRRRRKVPAGAGGPRGAPTCGDAPTSAGPGTSKYYLIEKTGTSYAFTGDWRPIRFFHRDKTFRLSVLGSLGGCETGNASFTTHRPRRLPGPSDPGDRRGRRRGVLRDQGLSPSRRRPSYPSALPEGPRTAARGGQP
ncbi:hypothetical protein ARTHRO8AJ_440115 [Arthrobacter sp. 8AJ]|nr:hypothetical protein ARTHRO8AJ_440115 [Arthrobacter sp. 8AJ]